MRPIPSSKHRVALLVILLVVAANTALTFVEAEITADQANMLAEAFKQQDDGLFGHDEVFGPAGAAAPWRLRLPAWRRLLAGAIWITGGGDGLNALRLLGAAALLLYLLTMYMLLYRQTRSTSVAVLAAVISTAIFSLKRPYWGLGPLFSVSPKTMYIALVPLIVQGLLHWHGRWKVAGVFLLAGLAGNIDFAMAVNLIAVMLIAALVLGRFRPVAWGRAAVSIAAAAAGLAPALWYSYSTFRAGRWFLPKIPLSALSDIFETVGLKILYPTILVEALWWLPIAAGLAIPAAIILSRAGRYRFFNLTAWIWLLAAALLVTFGLHGLMQMLGWWMGTVPPYIEFWDALPLAMLPLYAMFAQAMIQLFRVAKTHRVWAKAVLTVFAAVYLGSSYNTLPLRHMTADAIAAVAGEEPERKSDRSADELRAMARWTGRGGNTAPDALFAAASPSAEIRSFGRRSLLACRADVRYFYYLAPDRLELWAQNIRKQNKVFSPQVSPHVDPDLIVEFVGGYWRGRKLPAAESYAIVDARLIRLVGAEMTEIVSPDSGWGRHWRLFRILAPAATTAPVEGRE